MLPVPNAVATKLPHLPEGPGVYLWKGRDGTTLYVGKAKRLRSRVRSYFSNDQLESVKTRHLVGLIGDLETIVVPSEAHALILEANLIKEYRPRFNIALRDDKSKARRPLGLGGASELATRGRGGWLNAASSRVGTLRTSGASTAVIQTALVES